jgi:hypothetical protein
MDGAASAGRVPRRETETNAAVVSSAWRERVGSRMILWIIHNEYTHVGIQNGTIVKARQDTQNETHAGIIHSFYNSKYDHITPLTFITTSFITTHHEHVQPSVQHTITYNAISNT